MNGNLQKWMTHDKNITSQGHEDPTPEIEYPSNHACRCIELRSELVFVVGYTTWYAQYGHASKYLCLLLLLVKPCSHTVVHKSCRLFIVLSCRYNFVVVHVVLADLTGQARIKLSTRSIWREEVLVSTPCTFLVFPPISCAYIHHHRARTRTTLYSHSVVVSVLVGHHVSMLTSFLMVVDVFKHGNDTGG